MPLLVATQELQPGMSLAEAIVSDGRVMLRGGLTLGAADIRVLRRRFPQLLVRVIDPMLDSLIEFQDDARDRQVASEVQRQVAHCLGVVHERFRERESLDSLDVGALRSTVRGLMEHLKYNRVTAALVASCMDPSNYQSLHTANVFYLAMLLAFKVLDYVISERKRQARFHRPKPGFASDLVPLGLGTMVMDLGMLPLQRLIRLERPLTAEEREALRRHPRTGLELLPERMSALARMVVRTHHENMCGTGYPKGTPGAKLHVFTRIVRIADAFDSATSRHVYAEAKSPIRVLWEMTYGPYRGCYDPRLMRAFSGLIQPFPIGAKLRLTDGRYVVVVRYNRKDAFDPVVILAFNTAGQPLPRGKLDGPVNLSSRPRWRVASFDGEDLSYLYTQKMDELAAAPAVFVSAFQAAYP